MFRATVRSCAIFVIIIALSTFSPVPLDDKADPNNSTFVPYPAWYFIALYALVDIVGGLPPWMVQSASLFATIIGPTLLIVLLVALPFIDRHPSRRLTRRPWVLGLTAATMFGAICLSWYGQNNVVTGQLQHHIIGPGATLATSAHTASGQSGPIGTTAGVGGTT